MNKRGLVSHNGKTNEVQELVILEGVKLSWVPLSD